MLMQEKRKMNKKQLRELKASWLHVCKKCQRKFESQADAERHFEDMHTVVGQDRRRKQMKGF